LAVVPEAGQVGELELELELELDVGAGKSDEPTANNSP